VSEKFHILIVFGLGLRIKDHGQAGTTAARIMSLNEWSKEIVIAELNDEPAFSDDLDSLQARFDGAERDEPIPDVILNMKGVSYLNSSNIAQLLRLRKKLILSGFHEAALTAFAIQHHLFPEKRQFLQYTTTSPIMQKRLGVAGSEAH